MKYCLIGEKLGHSFSAEIHKSNGLDYRLVEVEKDKLADFFRGKYGDFAGFNVTIPYKKAVMPFLDFIDEGAKQAGAVNTVLKRDGKFYGYNTDIAGLTYCFNRTGASIKGKTVMIFGSGGASLAARVFCAAGGAKEIVTVSRTGAVNYFNCYDISDASVLINATPVGMYPDIYGMPFDIARFKNAETVVDLVYNPLRTGLILSAKERGIKCTGGLPMLVWQAFCAEKIWGYDVSREQAEKTEREILLCKTNVVLYGMPSSGKSTVGKILAEKLGKKFIDTDEEIAKVSGKTPAEIIRERGESAFRDIETEVIKKVAAETQAVIATGGGAVLRRENVNALKMNGFAVLIDRDISYLTAGGRPISREKGIERLYRERKELYAAAADITVKNDGDIKDCVDETERKFKEGVR